MNKMLDRIFKWDIYELLKNFVGIALFSIAINLFVEPNHLYSGGVLGLAQLCNNLVTYLFKLNGMNLTGIINLFLNIPLLLLAYFKISKSFCRRTIFTVGIQTVLLSIIPIPAAPLVNDVLTNVIIGGVLVGIGCALVLSATGSTGGTDIIGIFITTKYSNFSVGKISLSFNAVVFGISGMLYGISTMIYSILYSIVESISLDRLHDQNVSTTTIIFTKQKPTDILNYVKKELDRGATYWEGIGEYDKSKTYITYLVLSRYELHKLERFIKITEQDVFLIKNDIIEVEGNFKKRLSK